MSTHHYVQPRHSVSREEEKLWVGFYQRIHRDPTLANELLALMKADPIIRRDHLALYLCCRESLRRAQRRHWRDQQIARLLKLMLVGPWRACIRLWHRGTHITVLCLSDPSQLPADTCTQQTPEPAKTKLNESILTLKKA